MAQQKIWFDFVSNTIKVEANYLPQTRKVGSKAYKTLLAAKRDNPTATIETFGKREDKYNHITVSQMQTYFEVNGVTAGAANSKRCARTRKRTSTRMVAPSERIIWAKSVSGSWKITA